MTAMLHPDAWLSGHLGKSAHRLEADAAVTPDDLHALLKLLDAQGPNFVWTRLPADALELCHLLQAEDFRLMDVSVTLEGRPIEGDASGVRQALADDEPALVDMSRTAFDQDRFHADPRIPGQQADELYADWTANYFRARRGDGMLVAESGGRPAGFLLYLLNRDAQVTVIDSIAVSRDCQGQGLGKALVCSLSRFSPLPVIRVGTQAANAGALRFYQRCGLRVAGHGLVLHRHGGG